MYLPASATEIKVAQGTGHWADSKRIMVLMRSKKEKGDRYFREADLPPLDGKSLTEETMFVPILGRGLMRQW